MHCELGEESHEIARVEDAVDDLQVALRVPRDECSELVEAAFVSRRRTRSGTTRFVRCILEDGDDVAVVVVQAH